ncbi:hypothetical protein BJX66DRAFT_293413 [Aspergillus keveii]|uniref:Aminoglycoside phosphotransferase domain-containing protein n=1 Tax=Aspergillus keveii TaxID=714993 RepID=A0ABR4GJK3_9EURO
MVWDPVALPYMSESLRSSPLPTTEEIRACTNILFELWYKIVAINDQIVVKYYPCNRTYEGQVLLFLERHVPNIPVPRIYSMYRDPETRETLLIMQRIPGESLETVWPSLTESEKDGIVGKLRETFENLHAVPCSKPDYYGGLDAGYLRHEFFLHNEDPDGPSGLGPFYGEESFVAGMTDSYRARMTKNGQPTHKALFYETYLPRVIKGHRPTLTHCNLKKQHIMVVEKKEQRNEKGERSLDVVLLNWGFAGWYPEFFEFLSAAELFFLVAWEDD